MASEAGSGTGEASLSVAPAKKTFVFTPPMVTVRGLLAAAIKSMVSVLARDPRE